MIAKFIPFSVNHQSFRKSFVVSGPSIENALTYGKNLLGICEMISKNCWFKES